MCIRDSDFTKVDTRNKLTCIYGGGIFLWKRNLKYQLNKKYIFVNSIQMKKYIRELTNDQENIKFFSLNGSLS